MPRLEPVHAFAGNPLDRAGDRRADAAWIAEQFERADGLALAVWQGRVLVEPGPEGAERLAYLRPDLASDAVGDRDARRLFLGLWKETPVFAVEFEGEADPTALPLKGLGRFEELRACAAFLPEAELAIAGAAKSLFDWRRRHRFCSACGGRNAATDGGWKHACETCRTEHFPRTDPVVIMLPTFEGRCLLGRQAVWPAGRMSALAGFMEPGESIEEACARELKEEAGLETVAVRYHSSQPWPFPSQLMIGLFAEVSHDRAAPDQTELEAVRWFDRAEIRAVLAGGREVLPPPPFAIARKLMEAWAAEG